MDKDVPGTVVDVFEAVGPQQNAPIPASDHHQHIPNVQNLNEKTEQKTNAF